MKVYLRDASNLIIAFYITKGVHDDDIFKGNKIQSDAGFEITKIEEF